MLWKITGDLLEEQTHKRVSEKTGERSSRSAENPWFKLRKMKFFGQVKRLVSLGPDYTASFSRTEIGHFGKYRTSLCLSPQIFHKHCFQFLLGLTMVPRENKNNAYAKFGGTNKEYYGISRSGLFAPPTGLEFCCSISARAQNANFHEKIYWDAETQSMRMLTFLFQSGLQKW